MENTFYDGTPGSIFTDKWLIDFVEQVYDRKAPICRSREAQSQRVLQVQARIWIHHSSHIVLFVRRD